MFANNPARHALLAALVAAGFAASASAQSTTAPAASAPAATKSGQGSKSTLAADDRKFVLEAAMGGMAEVELGKLAQEKASTDAVKQFGSRMVTDHTKANEELKAIASAKGVTLPAALDKKHQADKDRLSKSSHFDKDYMDYMVNDHKKDVADFRKESTAGKDGDVRGFAAKTLPTLEDHLKQAQETAKIASSSSSKSGAAKK